MNYWTSWDVSQKCVSGKRRQDRCSRTGADNDVIRLNVKSKSGETINYNADVMIADESKDGRYYYVVPEITLNNIVSRNITHQLISFYPQ